MTINNPLITKRESVAGVASGCGWEVAERQAEWVPIIQTHDGECADLTDLRMASTDTTYNDAGEVLAGTSLVYACETATESSYSTELGCVGSDLSHSASNATSAVPYRSSASAGTLP